MRLPLGVVGNVERYIVVASDDELEFGWVRPEEGDCELMLGQETSRGEVACVDKDICWWEGLGEGVGRVAEIRLLRTEEVRV